MRRDEEVVEIFPVVHACCQPSEVEPFGTCTTELKLFFGSSADRFEQNIGFTGNISHRNCRISLDAFFDGLAIPRGVDCALSVASRTVTGMVELLQPFNGPPDIWLRDANLSRNVAVAHSLRM